MLDPFDELKIPAKDFCSVENVHFSGRGVTQIHPNFQKLVNLSTLWMSNNKLTKVRCLLMSRSWTDFCAFYFNLDTLPIQSSYSTKHKHIKYLGISGLLDNGDTHC